MNEQLAVEVVARNQERYLDFLSQNVKHTEVWKRPKIGIPKTQRAKVHAILKLVTVRVRDWA